MNLYLSDDGRLRRGWRFVVSVLLVVAANYVAGNVSALVAGYHYRLQEVIYRPLLMVLVLAIYFLLTKFVDQPEGSPWAYMGLPRRRWLRESLLGAMLGFGMITAAVIVIGAFCDLRMKIELSIRSTVVGMFVFGVLLAAAMAEELMFRGYPFQRLVEGIGATGAILVLSAMFGYVHMQNPHVSDNRWVQGFAFSNTLLIGVVLAFGYLRTKALWFPWGLHLGWNAALGLVYGLPVSGISQFAVVVKSKAIGPEWLLGGGYGIEGGMLGTLVILVGLAYVLIFLKPVSDATPAQVVAEPLPNSIQPDGGV